MFLYLSVVVSVRNDLLPVRSAKNREHHLSNRVRVDETVQYPADAKRGTNKRNYASK